MKNSALAENVVQLSAYQPKLTGTPAIENGVHLAPQGEGVYLGKSPANMGSQGIPDTTPLANSGVPGSHALAMHSETKVSPSTLALPHAELITLYAREWNSFRSRTAHCKKTKVSWPPEWETFKKFLASKGACPGPGKYTLHRINNDNPHYGPGLCKWSLPPEQNGNKSDNVLLIEPMTGKVWTPKTIAEASGVTENAIRKRIDDLKAPWTLYELLAGKKSKFFRELWLKLDALPKSSPAKEKILNPLKVPDYPYPHDEWYPVEDDLDHYHETGERLLTHFNACSADYVAACNWVDIVNAGLPVPPPPTMKYIPWTPPSPERMAQLYKLKPSKPPELKPAPTYSYKHDPADCMPDDEHDHDYS
jgi:hypothetical protein